MTAVEAAAEFVAGRGLVDSAAARSERINLHVLDTVGALLAGSALEDSAALGSLGDSAALASACAAARSTEVDDIHLSSSTTPGSVIVPVALYLASQGELGTPVASDASRHPWEEFSTAVLAGYESMIRLGFAADGPSIINRQIWPTYFAAAFGGAAVASRAFRLDAAQTAGALATALALSTGTATLAISVGSSRWLTVGLAAANGVMAARAARHGLLGSTQILERNSGRIAGVEISESRLLNGLGERFLFDDLSMKPYPVARQGLAAVEAARALVTAEQIEPASISEIVVGVPAAQIRVIDHPGPPANRMASIAGVQYQIALALLQPERLHDLRRAPPYLDEPIRELIAKIRVERAPELDEYYPEAWPGKVEIETAHRRFSWTVLHPPGDAKNPGSRKMVEEKFRRLAPAHVELIAEIRQQTPPARWIKGLPL